MSERYRGVLPYCVAGAITGIGMVLAPAVMRYHSSSLFVLVAKSVEHLAGLDLLLFFCVGSLWGLLKGFPKGVAAALFQPAFLPLIAIAEMFKDPTSHNLWPFEFVIYGFMGGVGALGASLGTVLRGGRSGRARNTAAGK